MFEVAELGHRLDKKSYKESVPPLRTELLTLQARLKEAPFPVLILISGVDGAGKGDTVNLLNEWFDPRLLRTFAFGPMSDEESERPEFWRFWRALPPKGHIGLYVGSWYSNPIAQRVAGNINDVELAGHLLRIKNFERELIDDGALIIKVWLHLSREAQQERLTKLASNPETAWRVTKQDRKHLKLYDEFRRIAEHTLRETSTGETPWNIIEGSDEYYRGISVGHYILQRIGQRLTQHENLRDQPPSTIAIETPPVVTRPLTLLGQLDMTQRLEKKVYRKQLEKLQGRLHKVARAAHQKKISSVIVMEGWDAGGKGGLIRRIIPALDARNYQVIPIAAPTDEERAHHYLWRFWRHIPRAGQVTIYDRSWYGRVLVERVEGFARDDEWMRAYGEINDFEEQLSRHGTVLLKFWLHIEKEEQLRRFKEREQISYKQYKITDEDYRNRERWDEYEEAVNDMVEHTSTEYAPWDLIEGNDKRFARIKALRLYCERLEQALE
ncbi:MAG: polyphosphate:AMP phosphotransferase [Chromatiales bacterium]|nr:polyphosphate:AMP phosphotransferase [Chromatiales bacterium]